LSIDEEIEQTYRIKDDPCITDICKAMKGFILAMGFEPSTIETSLKEKI
jgi:hypothetical protein